MPTTRIMTFSIYCFDPAVDKKPSMKEFKLDIETIKGKMLLNALEAIKEKNPDIGFRCSCGEGVCGSDGLNINGTNGGYLEATNPDVWRDYESEFSRLMQAAIDEARKRFPDAATQEKSLVDLVNKK